MRRTLRYLLITLIAAGTAAHAASTTAQASDAAKRAVRFLRDSVSMEGGYLWKYTADLSDQWGEGHARRTQVWVQPPGTPHMGQVFLDLWRATGDDDYLDVAKAAADALVRGQLASGGWEYRINFGDEHRSDYRYRVDVLTGTAKNDARETSTFDDNTTQDAVRFLIQMDQATDFSIPRYHDAVTVALDSIIACQFTNGAWPQWFPQPDGYHQYYTFNDNAINDVIDVMLTAWETYGDDRYLASAEAGGDFVILSQIAAPQSGWAQQYDTDLKPAWARSFEPPAVCSAVTLRNINTLIDLYLRTGEERFLGPIPAAIDWLERSVVDIPAVYFEVRPRPSFERGWARLYEQETNTPIFGDRDSKVHYTFDEISVERQRGYSWYRAYSTAAQDRYRRVMERGREAVRESEREAREPVITPQLEAQVAEVVESLEDDGRWVDDDGMISMRTYSRNLRTLANYLAAASTH